MLLSLFFMGEMGSMMLYFWASLSMRWRTDPSGKENNDIRQKDYIIKIASLQSKQLGEFKIIFLTVKMDFKIQKEQADRLKQILLPKNRRTSTLSTGTFFQSVKENKPINPLPPSEDLKVTLGKLKKDIEKMLQRQNDLLPITTTPRECLEQIKLISDSMENYPEAIEEACETFLESLPQPLSVLPPTRKYYFVICSCKCLNSIIERLRYKTLSEAFDTLSQFNSKKIEQEKYDEGKRKQRRKKISIINEVKQCSAFNRWRLSILKDSKTAEVQKIYNKSGLEGYHKFLSMISHEGKAINLLQSLVSNDADATQILIFNPKNGTLRAYVEVHEQLTSVFETVTNQSQAEDDLHEIPKKLKRIEFNLQKSLTKICLTKRQVLRIQELRNDPDYSRLDNIVLAEQVSGRQMIGGAIFTPLLNESGHSIGLIRQYYFDKLGNYLSFEKQEELGKLLEYCLKTSSIFQNLKEKIQYIQNDHYLKTIKIFNNFDKINKSDELSSFLQREFKQYFPIQWIQQYKYEIRSQSPLQFIIQPISPQEKCNTHEVITVLEKMMQLQTNYIFNNSAIYLKVSQMLYRIGIKNQINALDQIPVKILLALLGKKEQIKQEKEKEEKLILEEEKLRKQKEVEERQKQIQKQICEFCLHADFDTVEEIMKFSSQYSKKFLPSSEIEIIQKNQEKPENSEVFFSNEDYQFLIKDTPTKKQLLEPLKKLLEIKFEKKRKLIEKEKISLVFASKYDASLSPSTNIKIILEEIFQVENIEEKIFNNPFEGQFYFLIISEKSWNELKGEPENKLSRYLANYNMSDLEKNDKAIFICLNNHQAYFIRKNVEILPQLLEEINQLLKNLQKHEINEKSKERQRKKLMKVSQGFFKVANLVKLNIKNIFNKAKNYKKNLQIKEFYQRLDIFFAQKSQNILRNQFKMVKKASFKEQKQSSLCIQGIYYAINSIVKKKANLSLIFSIWKEQKKKKSGAIQIKNMLQFINSKILQQSFCQICFAGKKPCRDQLFIFSNLVEKRMKFGFEKLNLYSRGVLQDFESQCSKIVKLNTVNEIFKWISLRYPHYDLFLQIKGGKYLNRNGIMDSLQLKNQKKYEFITNSSTYLTKILWYVPEVLDLQLSDKHNLQFLSKAIEQVFEKLVLNYIHKFQYLKNLSQQINKSGMKKYLSQWRIQTAEKVKNEIYKNRDNYYNLSLQVNNLKQLEKQFEKDQEIRKKQLQEEEENIQDWIKKINEKRQTIVRLEVSLKKEEENREKLTKIRLKQEVGKIFFRWRKQAIKLTFLQKKSQQRQKNIKNDLNSVQTLKRILKNLERKRLQKGLFMIKQESYCAKLQLEKFESKALKGKEINRLMTFQDEIDESDHEKSQSEIILKQFSPLKQKKKVELTDEEMKKMNKGCYKLNPKTLKFLKRMGKIDS